jgi:hypothetical protein
VVVEGVHFLARLGVIACQKAGKLFSAITVTKIEPLEPSTTGCVGWKIR